MVCLIKYPQVNEQLYMYIQGPKCWEKMRPILYSNSYNLCSNSLFTFDTCYASCLTGHHHLRGIKNVYYALWADVGVLFSADSLWDNWPERVRGVI